MYEIFVTGERYIGALIHTATRCEDYDTHMTQLSSAFDKFGLPPLFQMPSYGLGRAAGKPRWVWPFQSVGCVTSWQKAKAVIRSLIMEHPNARTCLGPPCDSKCNSKCNSKMLLEIRPDGRSILWPSIALAARAIGLKGSNNLMDRLGRRDRLGVLRILVEQQAIQVNRV